MWRKLLLLAAAIYVFLPIDLIPDMLPVAGWLDDAAVVFIAVAQFVRAARQTRMKTWAKAP